MGGNLLSGKKEGFPHTPFQERPLLERDPNQGGFHTKPGRCLACFAVCYALFVVLCLMLAGCGGGEPAATLNEPAGDAETRMVSGLEMVRVPPGRYRMGPGPAQDDAAQDDAARPPSREVVFEASFHLSQFEITKWEWEQVMGTRPWSSRPHVSTEPSSPAVHVSFHDAEAFCARLSQATGMRWRLPTEAEWEYAARAGAATDYPFGDAAESKNQLRAIGEFRRFFFEEFPWARAVGMETPNGWSFFDMFENVREWCVASASGGESGAALRGDSWRTLRPQPVWTTTAAAKQTKADDIGFRVVCEGPGNEQSGNGGFVFSYLAKPMEPVEERPHTRPLRYTHPRELKAHHAMITAIAVTPEGDYVASTCWDMKLKLWSTETMEKTGEWHIGIVWHKLRISTGARFAALTDAFKDASTVVDMPYDITLTFVWDLEADKKVRQFDDECLDLAFSPDGRYFAFMGIDTLQIFDTTNWAEPILEGTDFLDHVQLRGPTAVRFSDDSETVTVLTAISRYTFRVSDGSLQDGAKLEPGDTPIPEAAFCFGEPALALSGHPPNLTFRRFCGSDSDELPYQPPIQPWPVKRQFTPDGRLYLECNRQTGLRVMTVPFFSEVLHFDLPIEKCCPVPGRDAVAAFFDRQLFLLNLNPETEAAYFVDDAQIDRNAPE